MTLVDYINNYRLEKSKDLIRSSEYNFTQIADMLGYTLGTLLFQLIQIKIRYKPNIVHKGYKKVKR